MPGFFSAPQSIANVTGHAPVFSKDMPQATVKSYDSLTKTGTLVSDDGEREFAIEPESMQTSMFRFLRPGQRVTFDLVSEDGEEKTRNLRIGIA